MHNIDWDNLRYVLVVAETGSIAAAAKELAVNRTTVLRRINSFEERLNCRLFERNGSGYVMSAEAEQMLQAAREVKDTITDLERKIVGRELRLEGEIRVTTTDALFMSTVGRHLASFARKHPHITVDLAISNHRLSITKRDADVAIRPTLIPPENLVGRKLADIEFAIYAAPSYLKRCDSKDLLDHRWLSVDVPLISSPAGQWLLREIPDSRVGLRADSFVALRTAAESGLGLALLPVALGGQSRELQCFRASIPELTNGLWILTHPDLVRSARVHAFVEHFTQALGKRPS